VHELLVLKVDDLLSLPLRNDGVGVRVLKRSVVVDDAYMLVNVACDGRLGRFDQLIMYLMMLFYPNTLGHVHLDPLVEIVPLLGDGLLETLYRFKKGHQASAPTDEVGLEGLAGVSHGR
jgi:hypothetical protein